MMMIPATFLFLISSILSQQISIDDSQNLSPFSFIKNHDSSEMTIRQYIGTDIVWYSMYIRDGCPSFEISGINLGLEEVSMQSSEYNEKQIRNLEDSDDINPFKTFVKLDMTQVGLIGEEISLKGGQEFWSPIQIEEKSDSFILHSTMIRNELDHSGNPFTIFVEGSIPKNGDGLFVVKEMVKNFPYPSYIVSNFADSGKLHITNIIEYSNGLQKDIIPFNLYGRKLNLGTMGGVDILESSVREDGNLLNVFFNAEEKMDQSSNNNHISLHTDLGFSSSFPKNTTFSMDMRLDKKEFMSIPDIFYQKSDKKVSNLSNGSSPSSSSSFFIGGILSICLMTFFSLH